MERIKIVVVALFVCSFASVHANVYYHIMVENIYGDGYVVEKWDVPEAEALSSYAYIIEYTDELDRVAKLVFYYKRWDSIWWDGIVDDPHCIYYSYGDSAISIVEMSYFEAIYESRDTVSGNSDIGRLEGNSTPFAYRMVIPCYKVDSCYYLNSQGYMEECYVSRNMIEYVQEYVQKNDLNTEIDLINKDNRLVMYDYFWNCINDNDVPSRMFPYKYDTIPFYSYSLKKVGMCREKKSDTQISSDSSIIYSGHIAKWLGVDPLADKYPDVSPYAYCDDNPLMYVDPDGEDVWELNEEGRVLRHIHDDSKDAFRMNGKEIAFDYGTVVSVNEEDQSTECRFYDSDAAISTFKFFSDNSFATKSKVEYGLVVAEKMSCIVTQHRMQEVSTMKTMKQMNVNKNKYGTVLEIYHNHPLSYPPSGYDGKTNNGKIASQSPSWLYRIRRFLRF